MPEGKETGRSHVRGGMAVALNRSLCKRRRMLCKENMFALDAANSSMRGLQMDNARTGTVGRIQCSATADGAPSLNPLLCGYVSAVRVSPSCQLAGDAAFALIVAQECPNLRRSLQLRHSLCRRSGYVSRAEEDSLQDHILDDVRGAVIQQWSIPSPGHASVARRASPTSPAWWETALSARGVVQWRTTPTEESFSDSGSLNK